jgi:pimeloyl-ACP methyl ester carboxylesterase
MSHAHGTPAEPPTAEGTRGATDRFPRPESRWADLGRRVHHVDHGGPADGPLLVCVHGLGGSLVNWAALVPLLTPTCRVLALDLAGFGLTQGGGDPTSVEANQQLLHRFLTEVAGPPAILVGNSMGGLIAAMQGSAHPETVAGLVLVDPALPTSIRARPHPLVAFAFGLYAVPPLGRALLTTRRRGRTPEQSAMDVLRLCCSDPGRVPADVLRQHVELARERHGYPDVDAQFLMAARSLLTLLSRGRAHRQMLGGITAPVLLLHGDEDRLVPVAAARTAAAAHPAWRFEVAEGVGHVPQLEAPEWTAGHVLDWLAAEGAGARDRARHATLD